MTSGQERHAAPFRVLGHGTVVVEGPPRVVVDPWRMAHRAPPRADVVLVTDGRIDHCSEEDVHAACGAGARVVAPDAAARRLAAALPEATTSRLAPGGTWSGPGILVRALPASAPPRARGFLRRGDGLTYLVETAGLRWLFLGASDALPEHEGLAPDVAFLAVGDFTVPSPEEAADAAARVRARLAVPTHWGDLSGRFASALRFAELCARRGIPSATAGAGD